MPAVTANVPPANGLTRDAPSIPPKEPSASPNLRGIAVAPTPTFARGAKGSWTTSNVDCIPSLTGSSKASGTKKSAAPIAPVSNMPAAPPRIPLPNSAMP